MARTWHGQPEQIDDARGAFLFEDEKQLKDITAAGTLPVPALRSASMAFAAAETPPVSALRSASMAFAADESLKPHEGAGSLMEGAA